MSVFSCIKKTLKNKNELLCICLCKLSVYCRSDVIVSGRNDITIYNNMPVFINSSPECGSTQVL